MNIISRYPISDDERNELSNILGVRSENIEHALSNYAQAALEELITMFLGKKVFTRGSDILEYRLYLLIKHAFKGRIPNEQDVSKLFQTTSSGSRSLIRAVMSKYQYLLSDAIFETLKECLTNADISEDGNSITLAIHNKNLVDELNRELADISSNLPPVSKKRNSVSNYEIKPSAYQKLCNRFGVESQLPDDE